MLFLFLFSSSIIVLCCGSYIAALNTLQSFSVLIFGCTDSSRFLLRVHPEGAHLERDQWRRRRDVAKPAAPVSRAPRQRRERAGRLRGGGGRGRGHGRDRRVHRHLVHGRGHPRAHRVERPAAPCRRSIRNPSSRSVPPASHAPFLLRRITPSPRSSSTVHCTGTTSARPRRSRCSTSSRCCSPFLHSTSTSSPPSSAAPSSRYRPAAHAHLTPLPCAVQGLRSPAAGVRKESVVCAGILRRNGKLAGFATLDKAEQSLVSLYCAR